MLLINFGRNSRGSVATVVVQSGGGVVEGFYRKNGEWWYFGNE